MKILQINSVCGIRSTGRICADLAEMLESQGHECKIAYGREKVPEKYKKYAVRIGSDLGVKLNALKARIFDNDGFNAKRSTKKFIEWIKNYSPDIVHLHNLHGYYLNIEMLFKFLAKADIPVVWTLHDCWAFTGHCAYFTIKKCEKWKTRCNYCSQKKGYPSSLLFDNSSKNYEKKKKLFTSVKNMAIVTPSEWLAELVEQSYLKKYSVQVINNGIDLSVFKPTESNFRETHSLQDKKIILGVASAWGERKGLGDFIKLSKLLDDKNKIVLVGLNKKQKKNLPRNVLGITKTNNVYELAGIYTAADVFFNPTYEDNYPTVNLEAQACGTPVVTYNTCGSVESVSKENVVNQGDIQTAIEKFNDKLLISNRQIFDKNEKFLRYIKLYMQVGCDLNN